MNAVGLYKKSMLVVLFTSLILLHSDGFPRTASHNSFSPKDGPLFDLDVVNMASDNLELSRLDLYVKITYDELQFIKADAEHFSASYKISAVIRDKTGERVDGKVWQEEVVTDNIDIINSALNSSISKTTFNLPPDEYQISLELQDLETLHKSQQERTIVLRDFSTHDIVTSDILYLDYISRDANGKYEFDPKVSSIKHEGSKLYAYFEVYNVPLSDSIHVMYEVINQENDTLETNAYWLKSGGLITQNFVEIARENLPHGKYLTKVQITNNSRTLSVERPFKWYWEGLPTSISDLDKAIEVLKYLVSTKELKKLKNTNKEDKHKAFIAFWKRHDPTPGTLENELRDEYYQRIQYANENFFGIRKDGWKTDMGWVYVKIGPPDAIERHPYSLRVSSSTRRTIKAFEIWDYYKYNRQLVFIDENGFGEFRLENTETFYDIIK